MMDEIDGGLLGFGVINIDWWELRFWSYEDINALCLDPCS